MTVPIPQDDLLLIVVDIAGHTGAHESSVRGWITPGEHRASTCGSRSGCRITSIDVRLSAHCIIEWIEE